MPEILPSGEEVLDAIAEVSIVPDPGKSWMLTLRLKRVFSDSRFKGMAIGLWSDGSFAQEPDIFTKLRFTIRDGNIIIAMIVADADTVLPPPSTEQDQLCAPYAKLRLQLGECSREFANLTSQDALRRRKISDDA